MKSYSHRVVTSSLFWLALSSLHQKGYASLDTCGHTNDGPLTRYDIVDKAEFGEFPWMVALLSKKDPSATWAKSYLGGGSLIHPKVVLTAAHKVDGYKTSQLYCRAGEWDWKTTEEAHPYQERNVKKIITHEDFYRPSVLNSVALLILEEPYDLTNSPHIGIGCVATALPAQGARCYSMGWGKNLDEHADAITLNKVPQPLLGRSACINALRRTRLGTQFQLHQSFLCAGGQQDVDTCKGDGGASLVCPIGDTQDHRYAIVGAAAWSIGCGEDGVPAVYANMPLFKDWIDAQMQQEGLPTDIYSYSVKKP